MDKVLILDGDADYVQTLKSGLDKIHQFETITATSGKDAIDIIESTKISVLATDIHPPDMDAMDILSFMTQKRHNTPCIIMTDYGKPWFSERMAKQFFLYHLEKPFDVGRLASSLFIALNIRDEGENFKGMSMASVLPLIEILQKTCRLEAKSRENKNKGYLYFNKGVLIDAHFKDLIGDPAAIEIATWQNIVIKLTELPRFRTRMRIKTKLMDIANANWEILLEDHQKEDANLLSEDSITETTGGPSPARETLEALFNKFLGEFTPIIGFLALAVLDEKGKVLVSHQKDDSFNLNLLGSEMNQLFSIADDSSTRTGLEQNEAFTLHTQKEIILLVHAKKESKPCFRLMGITSVKGNWIFMKMHLDKLRYELMAL